MIELTEAWRRIAATVRPLATTTLTPSQAAGRILAAPLLADRDLPAYDRSMLDGIVMRSADVALGGIINLRIVEEIPAGYVSTRQLGAGEAARIMTGAMVPVHGDTVVPVEKLLSPVSLTGGPSSGPSDSSSDIVGVNADSVRPRQNVQRRGAIAAQGSVLLSAGRRIGAAEIGLASEIGASELVVQRPVRCAVITTGDELVPADQIPATGQIRDSNGPMISAALRAWSTQVVLQTHASDHIEAIDAALVAADQAEADVIVLAGGVSAGKRDFVPSRLEAFGATCRFHKVSLKPGKPLWFGERDQAERRQWIFGLPGNPISSLIGAELFVKPLLAAIQGQAFSPPISQPLALKTEFTHRGDRPTYWPAVLHRETQGWQVEPLPWLGSADLPRVAQADGWIAFPAGDLTFAEGTLVPFIARTC